MSLLKPFIRLLSFFSKEVNEVRRQPRLVLSLLLGPFMILLLFGIGYQGGTPQLRTAIVLPDAARDEFSPEALNGLANFQVVGIESQPDAALERLRRDELDVVQIMPADVEAQTMAGKHSVVDFKYNAVNPLDEQWIQYLAYAQVVEMNKAILLGATGTMQQEAARTHDELVNTRDQLAAAESGISEVNPQQMRNTLLSLRRASEVLVASDMLTGGGEGAQTQAELRQLQEDIDALETAIAEGRIEAERERIKSTRERVERLETITAQLSSVPPDVIISPLSQQYENISGRSYDLMTYYAPGVLALLVQHIAVTLGALSMVRERLLGATEFFRVAPVNATQVLAGKYLGYTVFIAIIVALLCGLMVLIGIPFLGDPLQFAGLALLLIFASLGIGLFISSISKTDSQAVQFSMLMLLLSIFFSGFVLPLDNFWAPLRAVGYALPLTHGIDGFQNLLLRGLPPSLFSWALLGIIAILSAGGALFLTARSFRNVV